MKRIRILFREVLYKLHDVDVDDDFDIDDEEAVDSLLQEDKGRTELSSGGVEVDEVQVIA